MTIYQVGSYLNRINYVQKYSKPRQYLKFIQDVVGKMFVKGYQIDQEHDPIDAEFDRQNIEELKRSAPATGIKPAKKE